MANFFKDNPDLQYYFEKGLDWEALCQVNEQGFTLEDGFANTEEAVSFYKDVCEMMGQFSAEEIAPLSAAIDHEGVQQVDGEAVFPETANGIFKKLKELDMHGMCLPRELGGMNAPLLLYFINAELMARADVSVMAHHGFHAGISMAMLLLSIMEGTTTYDPETKKIVATRFQKEIEEISGGKAWGSMDITEPDAGSDMAAIRSFGEQDENGNWFVTGPKIFITSGHGKYHFVIARTEKSQNPDDPFAGLGGLSMFLVRAFEDGPDGRKRFVALDRVEEKLGHHGSATVNLTFERSPAVLVGKRGDGFKYMLYLMNNARLGVGFEAIGLCEAAVRMAKAYAETRPSMGKTIDRHEMIADYFDEMETDIQGIRAMAMYGAFHEELAQKLDLNARLAGKTEDLEVAREIKRHKSRARRVTPLLKYLAAEKTVEMARRNLQIHGGNGYMTEFPAEKLLRDALVLPIYEGTSQIQALMATKDTLNSIIKNPQKFLTRLAQIRMRAMTAGDTLERRVAKVQQLTMAAQQHLVTRTAADKLRSLQGVPLPDRLKALKTDWDPKHDFAFALLHSERLTKMLADQMICDVLWKQARKHPERRELLERYLDRAEPRCRFLHDEITTTGQRLLAKLAGTDAKEPQAVS